MTATPFGALCTIAFKVAEIEFELGSSSKRQERETQRFWYQVYVGSRYPRTKPTRKLTSRQQFMRRLTDFLVEIDRTGRLMRNLEVYGRYPPRLTGTPTKLDFLGFLIESHLHETYILRERIDAFSKFLERAYRKDRGARRIAVITKRIRRTTERTLRRLVAVRGEHVHVRRHRVPDIERLEFMQEFGSFAPSDQKPNFDKSFARAYRETRGDRIEHMGHVNESCQELIDYVGANVLHILLRRNLTVFAFPPDLGGSNNSLQRDRDG